MLFHAIGGGKASVVGNDQGDGCEGCIWVEVPTCRDNDAWIENGTIYVIDDAQCGGAVCAGGHGRQYWIFLHKPGWADLRRQPPLQGVCVTDDTPLVTGGQLAAAAEAAFTEKHVPIPELEVQPRRTVAVLNKPVIVWVGNHTTIDEPNFVEAHEITLALRAYPEYVWDFDVYGKPPGAKVLATKDPGAPYPSFDVSYVYGTKGDYGIHVQSRWNGEFQIAGVTDWIPITGTPTRTSEVREVRVREARAVLYDD